MSFGSTVNCPHCSAGNQSGSKFCESCGKALPEAAPSGPTVVNPYQAATTSAGQSVQSDELKKRSNSAFGALLAVGIMQVVFGVIMYMMLKDDPRVDPDAANILLATVIGVGVLFFGLAFWARVNPLPAAIVGLVLFVSLHLWEAVADPTSIARGIIFKVIIIVVLVKAIQAGVQHRDLRRRTASSGY